MSSVAFLPQHSLLKCPPLAAGHRLGVAGLDAAVIHQPGARCGPRSIRQASHTLCDGVHPHFDLGQDGLPGDAGDLPLPNTRLAAMRSTLEPRPAPCWPGTTGRGWAATIR